jgi:adenylylsulfate kinase
MGEITGMTGIAAPYEQPQEPDLVIETDRISLDEAVDEVIRFLKDRNMISCHRS